VSWRCIDLRAEVARRFKVTVSERTIGKWLRQLGLTRLQPRPDEARVGQKGTHAYVWAPVGSCPLMVRDSRFDSVHLFGAICPARGVGAALIMPAVNVEAMNEHLKEISTQVAEGAHAVVVLDGAGWHQRGGDLQVPDNITLLSLLPYAAELNPMENVWEYLRPNKLCALVWDTYDDIVEACRNAWAFLINDPDRIRTIGHRSEVRAVG
jgi:hypothetical protein